MIEKESLPDLELNARSHLKNGRTALLQGQRAAAVAAFDAAVTVDARAACHPWGLMPFLKAEGRASVRDRMHTRLQTWYRAPAGGSVSAVASLAHKARMREWAALHGFRTAGLIGRAETVAAIPPVLLARDRIVIKPINESSNRGVVILVDNIDHMTDTNVGPDRAAWLAATYETAGLSQSPVLVEEVLSDIEAQSDPTIVIPRDFKIFAIKGRAIMIRMHDRNGPSGKRGLITYDRLGGILPVSQMNWPVHPPRPVPPGFSDLVTEAERASALLPWLLRFDFYLTAHGPVLGEITTFPNAGRNFSPFARRTILQMFEIMPD